ncbi:hypothetical protein ERJ75_000907700 [Trypanosoma vivax]|nr:hypothetical protein ERJ75_000907700 [Trypanosoma vivax]
MEGVAPRLRRALLRGLLRTARQASRASLAASARSVVSCCSLRVRSRQHSPFAPCLRPKEARRHPQRQARAGVVPIDRRAAAGGTAWAQASPTSHKGRRWDNSGDAVQCEGGRVQWTRKEMRLGILCVLAAVAAALAQRRGAEAGDPPGLGTSEGDNKAADTLCGFGGKLEAAALAAEAVTARLAAGARAAARHAAVLEAARALAPRQAGRLGGEGARRATD